MSSEFSFINQIRQLAAKSSENLLFGIGDDAAAWREQANRERLITTDLLVEDVHFKITDASLSALGHKALAVSLSDIAAMGGRPEFALLSLGIPRERFAYLPWEDFFAGYFALAERFGVTLIGGDTSASPEKLVIDSIVLGSCPQGCSVRRSTAQIGDAIYVTGCLGASAAGLWLLQHNSLFAAIPDEAKRAACNAHLMPEPRVPFGEKVAAAGVAHAMMDISDGLAQDLTHICEESGVSAVLDFQAVPIADCVRWFCPTQEGAFSLAITGGEDYELLLTANPTKDEFLMSLASACDLQLTRIGEIIACGVQDNESRLFLRTASSVDLLPVKGYDHFRT